MELNLTIIQFISILTNGCKKADNFLFLSDKSAVLQIKKSPFFEVDEKSLLLLGKENIGYKVLPTSKENIFSRIDFNKLEKFCSNIDIVRLNHLGIRLNSTPKCNFLCSGFFVFNE